MDELIKEFNELTEDEWKQVHRFWNKKPCVSFSNVTLNDCVRFDGLALNIDNVYIDVPSLHIPASFPTPVATEYLCENLSRIQAVWVLDNKKACRILIDAILIEALMNEANEHLWGFCEVKNNWEASGLRYIGSTDFMLGSSKIKSVDNMDSFLLVVQAKKEWPDSAVPQVLAEAGCLLKKRLEAGKKTPVFAVLTSGVFFRFFAIDTDGTVYSSGQAPIVLGYGPKGDYTNSPTLSEIIRWITWFMTAISPSQDLTVKDSLTKLRNCFGPKHPISSKKIKIQK